MGRRMTCLILALLLTLPAALADADGYWTSNEDWYYHLSEYCGGAETMVPISLDGADAFGKYSCPACVPGENDGEIQAVIEGGAGILVVRIPDSCLGDAWFDEVNSYTDDASYEGNTAYRMLADYLSSETYVDFLSDYQARGSARASASQPRILALGNELVLSRRHLNGAWYFAVRIREPLRETFFDVASWTMNWRTDAFQLRMEDDVLICDYTTNTQTEKLDLRIEVQSTEPIFEESFGELHFYVTQAMNEYIALILRRADDAVPDAELVIGERAGIPLTGHINAGTDVYCCVLTEAELNALRTGATAELRARASWPAYYFGTPYAVQYDEDRGFAIVDREGKRVVDFGTYEKIDRDGSDKTFRCVLPEEMRYVYLDGDTLEQVGKERE